MSGCPGYRPDYDDVVRQLRPDDPNGKYNCAAYVGAGAAAYDSCGAIVPTGEQVRAATNEPVPDSASPGLTLMQVDDALRRRWGIDLDTRYHYPWADFLRRNRAGQGAILLLSYRPIRDSAYGGSETFAGGHAIFIAPHLIAMDPLADGRRPGLYRYRGEVYPEALLREAAGKLVVGDRAGTPIIVGDGYCHASFTRDNEPSYRAVVHPADGKFYIYRLASGLIFGRDLKRTGGFSASCTAPRRYRWPARDRSISLVRLTSGSRKDLWVAAKYALEVHDGRLF